MPYYEYYSFSYFFLIILLFFLILVFLFPNYTKKDIVPPLSESNYLIHESSIGDYKPYNTSGSTFYDLVIEDGSMSGTCAINFGTSGNDQSVVSYIPYYNESHKRIVGFFEVNIGTSFERHLAFRVVDSNIKPPSSITLESYNYGWSPLTTKNIALDSTPVYKSIIPFNLPGYVGQNHNIRLQIGVSGTGNRTGLELSSAYLYYYTV